jgi:hypothetical protein
MTDLAELAEGLYIEDYVLDEKKELEKKLKNESLLLSYKTLLNNPDGKRVLWDILSMCGVFQLSFTGNSRTYFNEGKRQIGLYIMTMLNVGNQFEDVVGFQKLRPKDGKS